MAGAVTLQAYGEEQCRQALEDLANLQHALDESTIVAITDSHGVITAVNEAFCQISQYHADELIGKTHRVINSGYHSKAFFKEMWETIQQGLTWHGVIRNRAKDGNYYWVDTTIVPFLDMHSKPKQYIAIRHDITPQKKAEEEVRQLNLDLEQRVVKRTRELEQSNFLLIREMDERQQRENELQQSFRRETLTRRILQLMDHSTDIEFILHVAAQEIGVFLDVDRCLLVYRDEKDVNHLRLVTQYCRSDKIPPVQEDDVPWRALGQIKESQVNEAHPTVLLNATGPEQFPASISDYLNAQNVQSIFVMEIRYRNISFGRIALHQCHERRIWQKPEIDFLESLTPSIGSALYQAELHQQEVKAKQEAEEANRQKSRVLSYVSHDFKNPLSSILRFIEILENDTESPLSATQHETLGYIREATHLLQNMVTGILDKARLEAGKMRASPQWLKLNDLLQEIRFLLSAMASQKNVEIQIDVQPDLERVRADPAHLRQILINLASNAIKYNRPNGKVFIRFSRAENETCLIIEVQDTGIGIPAEKIPNLFSEYYRADLSPSASVEGTGLGLTFVKKLVELYGGSLAVHSEVGIGSLFTIRLPLTGNNEINP